MHALHVAHAEHHAPGYERKHNDLVRDDLHIYAKVHPLLRPLRLTHCGTCTSRGLSLFSAYPDLSAYNIYLYHHDARPATAELAHDLKGLEHHSEALILDTTTGNMLEFHENAFQHLDTKSDRKASSNLQSYIIDQYKVRVDVIATRNR